MLARSWLRRAIISPRSSERNLCVREQRGDDYDDDDYDNDDDDNDARRGKVASLALKETLAPPGNLSPCCTCVPEFLVCSRVFSFR